MSKKLLILYVPAGGGHKAAAHAIAEAANVRGIETEVVDALSLTPKWFSKTYINTHLSSTTHVPELYGQSFDALNQRNGLIDGVRGAFDRMVVGRALLKYVAASKPRAVVATHFFPLNVLGHARISGALNTPVVGVVTDYNAHAFWAEPGIDQFCAPAGAASEDLLRHGVPGNVIVNTGIPIRSGFGSVAPVVMPAAGEPLRVLVTSGGFGIGPMVDIVNSFKDVPNVQLTLVCGDNVERVAEVKRAVAAVGVSAEVLGFEKDMLKRMSDAHLIVGKPGGLTVSESLAAGRPMLLVGAIPGQEMLNQAWLVGQGAAAVSEAACVGRSVACLRDDGKLAGLANIARSLSAPQAADRVVDVALGAVGGKKTHHRRKNRTETFVNWPLVGATCATVALGFLVGKTKKV